jgi:endoglycosylceramidase
VRQTALLLAVGLVACAPAALPPPSSFTVARGFIRDPQGRAVILRGANVSGRHKRAPYFDFHGADDYARMRREWGMNAVRFLVSWAALEPTRDAWDDAYLDEVARRVRLATDAGLLVFVDLHQDLYGVGFSAGNGMPRWTCAEANYASFVPTEPWFLNYTSAEVSGCFDGFWKSRDLQGKYAAAWGRIAARLADTPGWIGFDPMNEPYWGSIPPDVLESTRLPALYRDVIAAVRAHRPDALAFLQPAASRNLGLPTRLPVFDEGGIVYAPHAYDGDAEQGLGFDPSRRQRFIDTVAELRAEADALGAALVLGEYGAQAANPGTVEYMDAAYDAAGLARAGALYWEYGKDDGYALLASDGSPKEALLSAVARPFPERVAGEPGPWSSDGTTFQFTFTPDLDVEAPTLLSLPAGRFVATCEGCDATVREGQVEVVAHAGAAQASVTLVAE